MTVWKKIEGFPLYEVSDDGMVRRGSKHLKPRKKRNGYFQVALYGEPKKATHISVHRLVASAFVDNPEGKPWVGHCDHDKNNNRATNLEWCTPTENNHATDRAGRRHAMTNPARAHKLTAEKIAEIRRLAADGMRTGLITTRFGISGTVARLIVTGKSWAMPPK